MRKRLKVQPSYGYQHPECKMAPPAGVPSSSSVLQFDLKLVNWYPKDEVGGTCTAAAAAKQQQQQQAFEDLFTAAASIADATC
jgi:hypothetical protein